MLSLMVGLFLAGRHGPAAYSPVTPNPISEAQGGIEVISSPPANSLATAPPRAMPTIDAQFGLVLQTLQAWDDNDDEASRPQRLAELATLLNGTNMFELIQRLPAQFMGYAFAVPAVRERLLADPAAALGWMSEHPKVANSQLATFLRDWGQENKDGMSGYLSSLPDGNWKQVVMVAAAGQALSESPIDAITYARQMTAGQSQTALLQMAAASWARQDPGSALHWASQIQDPGLHDQMIGAIAVRYADIDPAQSMLQADQLPASQVADQTIADVAWKWAIQDPTGLAGYLTQLPENGNVDPILSNLIKVWANHEPTATMNWIENLPPGQLQIKAAKDMLQVMAAGIN